MIDPAIETVVPVSRATKFVPERPDGRKVHVSTLFRWAEYGLRGVFLEYVQYGGTRCTSQEAINRFFQALTERRQGPAATAAPTPVAPVHRGSPAQRRRDSEAACRELAEMGA